MARQKAAKARDPLKEEKTIAEQSARETLHQLKRAKTPAGIEAGLRQFFSEDVARAAWRQTNKPAYQRVRSGTAMILMDRKLALLNRPFFDIATPERLATAYLIQ